MKPGGFIKNPLTIIGIFAGIAEVSGTTVVSFLAPQQQEIFIWFLVFFPALLVVLFFLTLNFNHRVLYAPSDYTNEVNFLIANKFDASIQKEIPVIKKEVDPRQTNKVISPNETERYRYKIQVSNIVGASDFVEKLKTLGLDADIYETTHSRPDENEAIWLGKNVPAPIAIEVISIAKQFFPSLKYIQISGDLGERPPSYIHNEIYIGGASSTAKENRLMDIPDSKFNTLTTKISKDRLHRMIREYYPPDWSAL